MIDTGAEMLVIILGYPTFAIIFTCIRALRSDESEGAGAILVCGGFWLIFFPLVLAYDEYVGDGTWSFLDNFLAVGFVITGMSWGIPIMIAFLVLLYPFLALLQFLANFLLRPFKQEVDILPF